MATEQKHDDGQNRQVVDMIAAFMRDAEHAADLVDRLLRTWFLGLGVGITPTSFPAEFLLELAAVIRIAQWQKANLLDVLGEQFAPWPDLLGQLMRRLMEDPTSFSLDPKMCPAPLSRRVVWVWFHRCSRSAIREVGVDVAIQPKAVEEMLEEIANLIWKYRHLSRPERTDVQTKSR